MTEDEMAGWHHRLDGDEFGWTPGDGDGQGDLVCCNSWRRKELDMTEQLNWTELSASQVAQCKEPACQLRRQGFDAWPRKIPWRRKWQPIPVFLSGKSHGQRRLKGYSPQGCRVWHNWNDLASTWRFVWDSSIREFWSGDDRGSGTKKKNILIFIYKTAKYVSIHTHI